MRLSQTKYKDTYYFDVGYQLAFVTVIWTIGIFFSTIAPVIPMICFAYFTIKYWIDKYNMMFVYPPEHDTQPAFTESVGGLCTLAVFGFQIFMFVILALSLGGDFYVAAIVLLSIELSMICLKTIDFNWFYDRFREPDLIDDTEFFFKISQASDLISHNLSSLVKS